MLSLRPGARLTDMAAKCKFREEKDELGLRPEQKILIEKNRLWPNKKVGKCKSGIQKSSHEAFYQLGP